MMKKKVLFAVILSLAMFATACASGSKSEAKEKDRSSYNLNPAAEAEQSQKSYYYSSADEKGDGGGSEIITVVGTDVFTDEKLIYMASVTLETTNFEGTLEALKQKILDCKGFVQSESQNDDAGYWYEKNYRKTTGTLTEWVVIRIPTKNLNAFIDSLSGFGKVIGKKIDVQNITKAYADTESEIAILEAKQARYLEMIKKAETIDEILSIEKYLTDVEKELSILKSTVSNWDTDIAYSTLSLTIREVLEYSQDEDPVYTNSFWDRVGNSLKDSGKVFLKVLEFLLHAIIYLLPFAIVIGGIVVLIVVLSKNAKKKKVAKAKAIAEKRAKAAAPAAIPAPAETQAPCEPQNPEEQ